MIETLGMIADWIVERTGDDVGEIYEAASLLNQLEMPAGFTF